MANTLFKMYKNKDLQMEAWQTIRRHQLADARCRRDWNTEQGCGCAACRTARSQGVTFVDHSLTPDTEVRDAGDWIDEHDLKTEAN